VAQLCHRQEELERLKVRVLIISFSAPQFARVWLEETGAPFLLLLDTERRVYQQYGLERSVLRSWSPKTLWYYFRNWRNRPNSKLSDDVNQLGGDFVANAQGNLSFVYPSYDPVDRPSMEQIFEVLEARQ
jgi:hypothetical protein